MVTPKTPIAWLAVACLFLAACGSHGPQQSPQPFLSSISLASQTCSVDPNDAHACSVPWGLAVQFVASGNYTDSTSKDLTNSVAWTSSDTSTATVTPSGFVSPQQKDKAAVDTATMGTVSNYFKVTVTDAVVASIVVTAPANTVNSGQTVPLTATGTYTDHTSGNITGNVIWGSSNTAIATVNGSGVVTGRGPGQVTITATSGKVSATFQLTVLAVITVSAQVNEVFPSLTLPLTATSPDGFGNSINITNLVTWTSSDTTIATVSSSSSSSGVVTGVKVGHATITAASGTITGTFQVTVVDPQTFLIISPAPQQIVLGKRQPATVSSFSGGDVTSTATWSSSDPSIATVESGGGRSGLVTARASGSATLTATLGSLQGTASVTVAPQTSRFAIAANNADSSLSVFTVDNTTGQLTPKGYSMLPSTMVSPVQLLTHPSGKFAYVAVTGGVGALAVDPVGGTVTANAFYATVASPQPSGMATDPSGSYLYVAVGTSVFGFTIDASSGALSAVANSPTTNSDTSSFLAVDPTGQFLYSSNNQTDKIAVFKIGSGGALTAGTSPPSDSGINPAGLAFDPAGKYLYVANSGEGTIGSYSIDPSSGALTLNNRVSAGTQPVTLSATPAGKVYFFDATQKLVGSVSVDVATGDLTSDSNSAATAGSGGFVTSDLSFKFLYTAEGSVGQSEIFSLNQNGDPQWTGATATRSNAVSIGFVPGKQVVYVPTFLYGLIGNTGNGKFSIAPATGLLTSPVSADPSSIGPTSVQNRVKGGK